MLPGAEPFSADGGEVGVVLCHGFTGSPQSLRPWAEALAAAGHSVRLPLLPGHGTRWQDINRTTLAATGTARSTRAFGELARALPRGLRRGPVDGRRAGPAPGRGARRATSPGVVAGEPRRAPARPAAPRAAGAAPGRAVVPGDRRRHQEAGHDRARLRPQLPLHARRRRCSSSTRMVTRPTWPASTQPLLLLHSAVDHVVPPRPTRTPCSHGVASSDVTEIVLEDSYHVATLDNDAERIEKESLAFVDRRRGGGGLVTGDGDRDGPGRRRRPGRARGPARARRRRRVRRDRRRLRPTRSPPASGPGPPRRTWTTTRRRRRRRRGRPAGGCPGQPGGPTLPAQGTAARRRGTGCPQGRTARPAAPSPTAPACRATGPASRRRRPRRRPRAVRAARGAADHVDRPGVPAGLAGGARRPAVPARRGARLARPPHARRAARARRRSSAASSRSWPGCRGTAATTGTTGGGESSSDPARRVGDGVTVRPRSRPPRAGGRSRPARPAGRRPRRRSPARAGRAPARTTSSRLSSRPAGKVGPEAGAGSGPTAAVEQLPDRLPGRLVEVAGRRRAGRARASSSSTAAARVRQPQRGLERQVQAGHGQRGPAAGSRRLPGRRRPGRGCA